MHSNVQFLSGWRAIRLYNSRTIVSPNVVTQNMHIKMTIKYPSGSCAAGGHIGAMIARIEVQYTTALEMFLSQSSNGLTTLT